MLLEALQEVMEALEVVDKVRTVLLQAQVMYHL
jgi:hypothetical protein